MFEQFVTEQASLCRFCKSACVDPQVLLALNVFVHRLNLLGGNAHCDDARWYFSGNNRACANDGTRANTRSRQKDATRADKTIWPDLNPSVKICVGVLVPSDSHPAIVRDEIDAVANCDVVTDSDQVWLASKGIQVRTIDLDLIAYLCTFGTKVANWILVKGERVQGQV
jgi:hypothetical protein